MEKRKTELSLIAGINGSGKSTFLAKEIIPKYTKALVITPDPAEWKHVPTISKNDIRTLNGVGKLIYYGEETFEDIKKNYFGGVLILDDAKAYIGAQTGDTMRYLYIRRRQFGIDLYIAAHSIKDFPPKCFDYASWMILFYTNTGFKSRKNEMGDELYNRLVLLQENIKNEVVKGNPYYYQIILLDQQIKGMYEASKTNR